MIIKKYKINDLILHVREHQNINKETIVFLHCSGGNMHQWDSLLPYFKNNYQIIIPDLRGHGLSGKPRFGYTLNHFVLDIKALLDLKNLNHVHIIGSSLGGEIAVGLASKYPGYVKSIVAEGAIVNYFGSLGFYGDLPKEEISKIKEEILNKKRNDIEPIYHSKSALIHDYKTKYERKGFHFNHFREKFISHNFKKNRNNNFYSKKCPIRVGYELIQDYFDQYFDEYIRNVKCPILFLPSEDEIKDPLVVKALETFNSLLKLSFVKVIKGSSHAETMFDCHYEMSHEISLFIDKIR